MDFSNASEFTVEAARIAAIGVGGGGNNTINALKNIGIKGAYTIAFNTDAKHLAMIKSDRKILIGKNLTRGLGAGGFPDVGKNAALESRNDIKTALEGVDLCFVTCGLGGGTGTGAAPVVARIAREQGAIVIGVVTLPFKLEGARQKKAHEGLNALREVADTVVVIENQRLLEMAGNQPLKQAFNIADTLIATMIKGISETISEPSLVNLDFADVKAIMRTGGVAAIGVGEADSDNMAEQAVAKALNHPLVDVDIAGGTGALIQIIGGPDMKLEEITKIGEAVSSQLSPDAPCIWGARVLPEYAHKIQVITIVTGVKSLSILGPLAKAPARTASGELGIEMIHG